MRRASSRPGAVSPRRSRGAHDRTQIEIPLRRAGRRSRSYAANDVEIIKVWVDDPDGQGAEAHAGAIRRRHRRGAQAGLRVTAHIFNLEDAEGPDALRSTPSRTACATARSTTRRWPMFKARRLVLTPNLPDRGVKVDRSWMQAGMPADEFAKLEEEHRPAGGAGLPRHPGAEPGQHECGGRADRARDRRQHRRGGHEEMEDMVLAGMTPMQVIVSPPPATAPNSSASPTRARSRPARAPTSSSSTPTRSTTSRTPDVSRRSISVRPTLINTIAALQAGDRARAKAAFEAYDSAWNGIEVYVNVRSKPMYETLEHEFQARITKALDETNPNVAPLLADVQAMLARFDEMVAMIAPMPPHSIRSMTRLHGCASCALTCAKCRPP